MLANRVPPDVTGDMFDLVRRAKNMVVVARLPERPTVRFAKFEGGTLLEEADELE